MLNIFAILGRAVMDFPLQRTDVPGRGEVAGRSRGGRGNGPYLCAINKCLLQKFDVSRGNLLSRVEGVSKIEVDFLISPKRTIIKK